MSKKLYIFDASGYLYRAYHALLGMKNAQGVATNALYGFIRSIHKFMQTFSPQYCVAVFDGPKSLSVRRALYADYKAHRASMPDDLRLQRDLCMEFCTLSGIPLLSLPDIEADDTMASVALWAAQEGAQVFLCTSDKDMAQLVSPQIQIMNPSREHELVDEAKVFSIYGVRPDQIADFLALTGDASDHVPGVPGLGPKGAAALLQEFGTLEALLNNLDKIRGKRADMLRANIELARLSKLLVSLHTNAPFTRDLNAFKLQSPDKQGLQQMYRTQQFHTLLEKSPSTEGMPALPTESPVTTHLVQDEASLQQLLEYFQNADEICIRTESSASYPIIESSLVGVGFACSKNEAWYVPFNGTLPKERLCAALKELFSRPDVKWVGHNIKHDAHLLAQSGLSLPTIGFDTLIASSLLAGQDRAHTLEALGASFLDLSLAPLSDLTGTGKKAIPIDQVPILHLSAACSARVTCIYLLKELFAKQLVEENLRELFYELELPLLSVLLHMEQAGIFIDLDKLSVLREELQKRLKHSEEEIYAHAGERFSINSPKQLSVILFDKQGLTPVRKTATGFSTDAEVLETLAPISPLAREILQYRTLEKLRSTYVDALPLEISPRTGRIHPTYHQATVATGRLSCQNPNLQNIPIRSEEGRLIRAAFCPQDPSWFYLGADYSQIELRFLAHFSQDEALLEAFTTGRDIHTHTASLVLQKSMEEVTPAERQSMKAVNFGIIYGQQAFGLSRELGISRQEAAQFIELYFQRYPKVREYIRTTIESVRAQGFALTLCGRRRFIPEIKSHNPAIRAAAERLAVNTPLQGSAADLIKKAMLAIDRYCLKHAKKTKMIAQIHDELLFELPQEELAEMEKLVKAEMQHAMQLSVPLLVDLHIGKNWKEC